MPFAARAGFLASELVTAVVNWFDLTSQDVSTRLSTWTSTGTPVLTTFNTSATHTSAGIPYRAGVLGADGKIYVAPGAATGNILVIDPATNTSQLKSFGLEGLGSGTKYSGGLLAPNGKIYFPPHSTNKVLIIDPVTETHELQDWGLTITGTNVFPDSAMGADKKMYCVGTGSCLIIDPAANTASISNFGGVIPTSGTSARWVSGVLAFNNKIYFAPYNNTQVLMIDPANSLAVTTNYGTTIGSQAHRSMCNAPNGKLYMAPHNQAYWSIVDPVANTYVRVSQTGGKSMGAFTGADGNIYAVPHAQSNNRFAVFNVGANTASLNNYGISLGGTGNQWWGDRIATNGVGYALAGVLNTGNTHILAIDTKGTGTSDPLYADIVKTAYFNSF